MAGARILVVEDDEGISQVVEHVLQEHGFRFQSARDGESGLLAFKKFNPELVLLDLNLPRLSGFELFKAMRELVPRIPVIMMTARSEDIDRILGLEMGADDYVTKPFIPRELVARVNAVLRRSSGPVPANPNVLEEGPLRLLPAERSVTLRGKPLRLKKMEFDLLAALVRHPARLYSRDELISALHGPDHLVTERTIDACVRRVRQAFRALDPDFDPVESSYGIGYKLNQSATR